MGEQIISIIINILSSILYDGGKYTGSKRLGWEEHKGKQGKESLEETLQTSLAAFLRRHEDCLFLDSDWFAAFLKYQRPLEKLLENIVYGNGGREQTEEEMLERLLLDTRRAAKGTSRSFGSKEEAAARELYQLLVREIRNELGSRMTPAEKYRQGQIERTVLRAAESVNSRIGELKDAMADRSSSFTEKAYEYPSPYLKRFCSSQEKKILDKREAEEACCLSEICQRYPCVVLLGEAGSGKTTELQWVAACYSENKELPRPVLLTLKTYVDETMEGLAQKQGFAVEEEKELLFIIDGFDEISGACRQSFLKRLTDYHEQRPKARFLISARNHFYREGMLGDFFTAVWLEPLTPGDAAEFAEGYGLDVEAFLAEVQRRRLEELLLIPFYLLELCGIYKEQRAIPERRELMRELIDHKFSEDFKKFRMTEEEDLAERRTLLFSLLQRLGAAMHGMDCRSLTEEEYQCLIPDQEERRLLSYSGIWKRQEGCWQFSHNNFGEYLAAEYLSGCSPDEIKELVSAGYPELGIRSNWYHVLSYLLPIADEKTEKWLLDQDFTLFFDFDRSRLPASERTRILRREWERLRSCHGWITRQRYRAEDLIRFGMSYTAVGMFLEEIQKPEDEIVQQNAILALGRFDNLFGREKEVKEALLTICCSPEKNSWICTRAILALSELGLMDRGILSGLVEHFSDTDSSEIRYGLYYSIRVLERADVHIRFLTDGLTYVQWRLNQTKGRLGNETCELHYALMAVKEPAAILQIIRSLIDHPEYHHIYKIEEVVSCVLLHLAEQEKVPKEGSWKTVTAFYEASSEHGWNLMEEAAIGYFAATGTKERLFREELGKVTGKKKNWWLLNRLLDEGISRWVLEQYKEGRIRDEEAAQCIGIMHWKNAVFPELAALYQERTGIQIPRKPVIDYEALRRQGAESYRQAIICREKYLDLVDEWISLYGKEELTLENVKESSIELLEKRYDLEEIRFDYLRSDSEMTVQEWRQALEEQDWKDMQVYLLRQWLYQNENREVPEEIVGAAREYYDSHIEEVDFARSIVWDTDTEGRVMDSRAEVLLFFASRFGFPMSKEKAEGICPFAGIMREGEIKKLLERCFTEEELRQVILDHMKGKERLGEDLYLHLFYCRKFKLEQCAETIRKVAADAARPDHLRQRAIEYFCQVIGSEAACQALLPHLDGELFFHAVSQIIEDESEGLADLLWEYAGKDKENRVRCLQYLIWLQDIRGVAAYRQILEQERRVKRYSWDRQPAESIVRIRKESLWEELFLLVELWLEPDFEDTDHGSLARAIRGALTAIAGDSEKGFRTVCAMLDKKISSGKGDLWKNVQMHHWLEDVRESYKKSAQRKWSLKEARKRIFTAV